MLDLGRRRFLRGLALAVAAPAIVRAASLMPVRALAAPAYDWTEVSGSITIEGLDIFGLMVRETIGRYGQRLAENVTRNNSLMARLIAGDRLALR